MEMLWGLIIKQEELYFRLKSKSYLINNQELAPFSLDNLKMVFHIVRGLFNSRKWKNSFVEKENLSLIFVCLRFYWKAAQIVVLFISLIDRTQNRFYIS